MSVYLHPLQNTTVYEVVRGVSRSINRVSRAALEAMNEGVEEVRELVRSGYFVQREENTRLRMLVSQAISNR